MRTIVSYKKTNLAAAIALASAMIPQSDQAFAVESVSLEEIIVTATRREMNASDIPFNISAITGEEIESANITDVQELMRAMPGISVSDGGGRFAENNNVIRFEDSMLIPQLQIDVFCQIPRYRPMQVTHRFLQTLS